MEQEIWKPIIDYEGLYEVSNIGRVKSLPRLKSNGKGVYITKEIIIKKAKNELGYEVVSLYKNKESKMKKVHRLVCESFLIKPQGKNIVNHKDGNPCNNNLENLEWCTNKENTQHALENGLFNHYSLGKEKEILDLYLYGFSTIEINKIYKVARQRIKKIVEENGYEIRKSKLNEKQRKEMFYMFDMNFTNKEISEYFQCKTTIISNFKYRYKKGEKIS